MDTGFAIGVRAATLAALLVGCSEGARSRAGVPWQRADASTPLHPVEIVSPEGSGGLSTALTTVAGARATIGCATCHAAGAGAALADPTKASHTATSAAGGLHADVRLAHGRLACASCHVLEAPDHLRLASGETLPITRSIDLCSQCHGPIRAAFDRGAHGGKRGYWDRQRGPQIRNDCITCHDPHRPAYPKVTPMAGPKDRFIVTDAPPGSLVERRYPQEARE